MTDEQLIDTTDEQLIDSLKRGQALAGLPKRRVELRIMSEAGVTTLSADPDDPEDIKTMLLETERVVAEAAAKR